MSWSRPYSSPPPDSPLAQMASQVLYGKPKQPLQSSSPRSHNNHNNYNNNNNDNNKNNNKNNNNNHNKNNNNKDVGTIAKQPQRQQSHSPQHPSPPPQQHHHQQSAQHHQSPPPLHLPKSLLELEEERVWITSVLKRARDQVTPLGPDHIYCPL